MIMQRSASPEKILLGMGIFKVDNTAIGLTRDGGQFTVEVENRNIEADGDRGPVKGRIIRDKATPKIQINHLELLTALDDLHPAVSKTTATGTETYKGTGKILATDYHTVEWVGETKAGKAVTIKITNAINLENIDWALKDKDEIIDTVTFTGTYEENATDEFDEGWQVTYATA